MLGHRTKFVVSLFCFAGFAALAGEADEIVAKHIEAKGGAERWQAVRTMKVSGTYTAFSIPGPFLIVRERPVRFRFDHTLGGKKAVVGLDGDQAWWINLWFETETALNLMDAERKVAIQDAEFATPFFDYKARGFGVEFLGRESLDGQECLKLKLTRKDGEEETWFLDPETYLEVARISAGADFGSPMPQNTYYSDFREVGGLTLPHHIEWEYGIRHRMMEVETVALNVPVEGEIFEKPIPEAMKLLQSMVGRWRVKVETPGRDEEPWQERETLTSEITALAHGGLLQERFVYTSPYGPIAVARSFSHDQFRNRYRMTRFDDFTYLVNVFEGEMKDGRLVMDNLDTGTARKAGDQTVHDRFTVKDLDGNGFVLESETSEDGGETWRPNRRFTYAKEGSGSENDEKPD